MGSFLTLEDINTVNLDNINEYYVLDTSEISEDEFTNVLYDFCTVSHSISGSLHTFTVTVNNSLWCGNMAVAEETMTIYHNNKTLTIVTEESSIHLYLYLCSFAPNFIYFNCNYFPTETEVNLTLPEIGTTQTLTLHDPINNADIEEDYTANEGVSNISVSGAYTTGNTYIIVNIVKTDVPYNITNTATIGIENTIPLNIDSDYLPNGSMVGSDELNITIINGDETITAYYDSDLNDYCFNLDLTEKLNNDNIPLTIQIHEGEYNNSTTEEIKLPCTYATASSFTELQSQITAGSEIIELTNTITFQNAITLPNDLYIIGDNNTINLGNYNINIPAGKTLRVKSANITNGQACFVQYDTSKLILEDSTFTNSIISDTHKGSVVTANYEETITEITGCEFNNCHHTIFSGGELNITNCNAVFDTWNDNIDTDYPAFLTAYDGNVEISYSDFRIDYSDYISTLTTGHIDLEYAQSLIGIGEFTNFNGTLGGLLQANDCLPFTTNTSYVYAVYYYPELTENVEIQPATGYEDKAICHSIVGNDWIYKNNVTLTVYTE